MDLNGASTNNVMTNIPYEKGLTFVWYLEEIVGGAHQFEPFLRAYFREFMFKSIYSEDFKVRTIDFHSNVLAF